MDVNRTYKDSVFSLLFSDTETLRELYCALEGWRIPAGFALKFSPMAKTPHINPVEFCKAKLRGTLLCKVPTPDLPITINTLEGVLFMERVNDISFAVANKLVLILEHQSTVNPNMPLRCLLYLARLYEKIINNKDVYKSRLLTIPRPECFVLYNGTADYPDETRLKLSDAFAEVKDLGLTGTPDLELAVRVININKGHNRELVGKCGKLEGYSDFIEKAREYEKELGSREEGVKAAVKYCIGHGILRDFLELHSSEVFNMLFTEWNWDDAASPNGDAKNPFLSASAPQWAHDALAVRFEEGREEIARNALTEGLPAEIIQKITGLDIEVIRHIAQ